MWFPRSNIVIAMAVNVDNEALDHAYLQLVVKYNRIVNSRPAKISIGTTLLD